MKIRIGLEILLYIQPRVMQRLQCSLLHRGPMQTSEIHTDGRHYIALPIAIVWRQSIYCYAKELIWTLEILMKTEQLSYWHVNIVAWRSLIVFASGPGLWLSQHSKSQIHTNIQTFRQLWILGSTCTWAIIRVKSKCNIYDFQYNCSLYKRKRSTAQRSNIYHISCRCHYDLSIVYIVNA